MNVRRTDLLGPIGSSARLDAETGFLHAPIRATRTGVFLYQRKDGTTSRELRHPEDVFDPESLESLKRVPLVKGHPRKADGSPLDVTTSNVEKLQVGHAGDTIERVQVGRWDHPQVSATVTRSSTVEDITQKGLDQVSMGYRTVMIEESGTYLGEPYDRRQTRIRYNHCAVAIPAGRGGYSVAFQLDEADAVQVTENPTPPKRKTRSTMLKLTIDGATCEFEDTSLGQIVKSALDKRDAKIDAAEKDAKSKSDALDVSTAKLDQAAKDLAEKVKADEGAPDMAEAIVEVLEVVAKADAILDLDAKAKAELLATKVDEGETLPSAIRKAVVLKACEDEAEVLATKSDAYLEARFDSLTKVSAVDAGAQSAENLRRLNDATGGKARGDSKPKSVQERLDDIMAVSDPLDHIDARSMRTRAE